MEKSSEIVKKAGIVPNLQLATKLEGKGVEGTGPHTVKMISDRIIKGTDFATGEERAEIEYLMEEKGQKKKYSVPVKDKNGEVHYLVQRLADVKSGEEVVLEYKRKGVKGYIDVDRVGVEPTKPEIGKDIPVKDEDDTEGDEIPVLEDDPNFKKDKPEPFDDGEINVEEIPF